MNDETEKYRGTTASQQSQQPRSPSAPIVTPTKGGDGDGVKNSGDEQKRMDDKDRSDDSTEWPNARRPGDKPAQPIEGQRRDQGARSTLPVGEEDKQTRGDQQPGNPGYSPFRPQGESKGDGGSAADRSGTNRSSQQPSQSQPAGDSSCSSKQEQQTTTHTTRDVVVTPVKGADVNAPKPITPTTPLKKAAFEHNRDDDKSSRK